MLIKRGLFMSKTKMNVKWMIFITVVLALGIFAGFKLRSNKSDSGQAMNIPIAMSLDDGYLYPTIVAITSIMENSPERLTYDFHVMHTPQFKQSSKDKLMSLEKKYPRCRINLIDMGNSYNNAYSKGHVTTPAYYRLSLSELLPDLDKILWIDGDTLTFHGLDEMYNIDMTGYYYKGFLDDAEDNFESVKNLGVYNDHCICDGVMVVNLAELRKDNMVPKFKEFIAKNNDKLFQHDQTTINALCVDKIGIFPAKYGLYSCYYLEDMEYYTEKYKCSYGYTVEELEEAYKDPTILHCVVKPWRSLKVQFANIWWRYARKTDYFKEICETYCRSL